MNQLAPFSEYRPVDRRSEPRSKVIFRGHLLFGAGNSSVIDCLITEVSAHGARVETSVMSNIPDLLQLKIRDGNPIRARRCWAKGVEIGLEFLDSI